MPHRFYFFCVTSILVFSYGCNRAPQPTGPPQIYFPNMEEDLGDLPVAPDGEGYSVTFAFKNRGLSPLQIERTVSSCGCARAHVSNVHTQPGEEGKVTVHISPETPESRKAYVEVHSNDPVNPLVKLRFSWRAVAPLEFRPYKVDFGTLRPGETAQRTLDLLRRHKDERWPSCRIEGVYCTHTDHLKAIWIDASGFEIEGAEAEKLRVKIIAGEEPGEVIGSVMVQLSECWNANLRIPIRWRVQDVVEAAPSSLMVGTGSPGETRSGTVVVSALAEERLEVTRAELINGDETSEAQWEQMAPNRVLVHVEMILPDQSGLCKSELRIVCSKPVEKTLIVPVSAFVTAGDSGG